MIMMCGEILMTTKRIIDLIWINTNLSRWPMIYNTSYRYHNCKRDPTISKSYAEERRVHQNDTATDQRSVAPHLPRKSCPSQPQPAALLLRWDSSRHSSYSVISYYEVCTYTHTFGNGEGEEDTMLKLRAPGMAESSTRAADLNCIVVGEVKR